LGIRPHEELPSLYKKSGALIFPSLTESFGLPLIEAASLGVPVWRAKWIMCTTFAIRNLRLILIPRVLLRVRSGGFSGVDHVIHEIVTPEVFLNNVFDFN